MKKIIENLLFVLSKAVLAKYQPQIIGITGSIGKTSVKDAVALVMSKHSTVRATEKNYNNEIGVPLTIIGARTSPGKSVFGWAAIFLKALFILCHTDKRYPQTLVLEMGADRPGDIEALTKLAPCSIGIITMIAPAHLEFFSSFEALEWEKKAMYRHLSEAHCALVNIDDPLLAKEKDLLKSRVITYGTRPDADVFVGDIEVRPRFCKGIYAGGVRFVVCYKSEQCAFELPNVSNKHLALATLPAIAAGIVRDIPLAVIAETLHGYHQPNGRMKILHGIKQTLIIDDTYNSSPVATRAALDTLCSFELDEQARRIAVLGDMRELGEVSNLEHNAIGRYAVEKNIDLLVTVGSEAREIVNGARDAGRDARFVLHFDDVESAKVPIQNLLKKGDCILVKGSQAVRLEKIVEEIMAEPEHAKELLVRQGKEWK